MITVRTLDLEEVRCEACGAHFAIERALMAHRRKTGDTFWCPNGHRLSFRPTELQEAKAELARMRSELDACRAELEERKPKKRKPRKSRVK